MSTIPAFFMKRPFV